MIPKNKIVLIYHSISSLDEPEIIGSFPITFERFKHQVCSLIGLGYESGKLSSLYEPVSDTNDKKFYITGDDGTVDWSRNVLPWCEDNEIYTHTAIITGPWEKIPVFPLTHLVQIILSTRTSEQLKSLVSKFEPYMEQRQMAYIHEVYSYENIYERRVIKGACNLVFQEDNAIELIGELTDMEIGLLHNRFESSEYYKKYEFAEVGVHTRTHRALDRNTESYVADEIDSSWAMLSEKNLESSAFFTLPMKPKFGAKVNSLIEPLKERGYEGILTSFSGYWDQKDFVIPRIDASQVEETVGFPALVESGLT